MKYLSPRLRKLGIHFFSRSVTNPNSIILRDRWILSLLLLRLSIDKWSLGKNNISGSALPVVVKSLHWHDFAAAIVIRGATRFTSTTLSTCTIYLRILFIYGTRCCLTLVVVRPHSQVVLVVNWLGFRLVESLKLLLFTRIWLDRRQLTLVIVNVFWQNLGD